MKFFLLLLMTIPTIIAMAQDRLTAVNLNAKNIASIVAYAPSLPATQPDKKTEWQQTAASHIPFKAHVPHYDTVVSYGDDFTREDLEDNAKYYFENVFGSKAYRLETHIHNYTGYGCYLFCADRKIGAPALYKVYYRVAIHVKNNRYYVDMYDFTLENQHSEVSFEYLMNKAKNNDSQAKNILALFHSNNEEQLQKVYGTMALKDRQSTAFSW